MCLWILLCMDRIFVMEVIWVIVIIIGKIKIGFIVDCVVNVVIFDFEMIKLINIVGGKIDLILIINIIYLDN